VITPRTAPAFLLAVVAVCQIMLAGTTSRLYGVTFLAVPFYDQLPWTELP